MIDLHKKDGLWTVTLNRPEKANALTRPMLEELSEIADATHNQANGVQVLVLTGAGRVFSAGADLEAARAGLATDSIWERLSGLIASSPCLTIAALNGTLAGGAFGMVLACDLRLAVPNAKFFYPVMKLGYLPQPSDPARLAELAGPSRAKLILMGGAKLTTREALACGLVDRVCSPETLLGEARALAADSLAAGPKLVRQIKAQIRTGHA